jgi:hypothetical protein
MNNFEDKKTPHEREILDWKNLIDPIFFYIHFDVNGN